MGKLNASRVRTITLPGRYADGDGLFLQVRDGGARSWMLRVQSGGRRRDFGLGDAGQVALAEARDAASEVRRQIRQGLDPLAERRKKALVIPTFKKAAIDLHQELLHGWKNGKHTDQWIATLQLYAFPKIGWVNVDQIDGPMIREVLSPIWLAKPGTARRVKQRVGAVLDWSYAKGFRSTEAPLRSIGRGLPRQSRRVVHFAALPYTELPAFLVRVREQTSFGRYALEALILTATRSGEIRGARWSELDAALTVWTIPAERTKTGVAHRVPLSSEARRVFETARGFRCNATDLVFPGRDLRKPLSDMTLLKILRDMELPFTVHGFRSTFRDWAAEQTDYSREVAEAALAHALQKVEAAYRRTDYFEKRRTLMDDWGAFASGREQLGTQS